MVTLEDLPPLGALFRFLIFWMLSFIKGIPKEAPFLNDIHKSEVVLDSYMTYLIHA